MTVVDLSFRVVATSPIPADHGYPLYSCLSPVLPAIHETNQLAVHPIRGRLVGGRLTHTPQSRLTIRMPHEQVPDLMPLAGKALLLGTTRLQLRTPEVRALVAAPALWSRLVVIKIKEAPSAADLNAELFTAGLRRQLDTLGVSSEIVASMRDGAHGIAAKGPGPCRQSRASAGQSPAWTARPVPRTARPRERNPGRPPALLAWHQTVARAAPRLRRSTGNRRRRSG